MKLSVLVVAGLAGVAAGQTSITLVDMPAGQSDMYVRGISADGLTVIGYFYQSGTAVYYNGFLWSAATGFQAIARPAPNALVVGNALNADASVAVGSANDYGFRWGAVGYGYHIGTGSSLYDVSFSGDAMVGGMSSHGYYKSGAQPWVALDHSAGMVWSSATAVSGDGATAVGFSYRDGRGYGPSGEVFYVPTKWVNGGAPQALPPAAAPWQDAWYLDVSADGAVTVGSQLNENGETRPFRHSAAGGVQLLGSCGTTGYAQAVSADGRVVVGDGSCGAWVWDATHGLRTLQSVAVAAGLSLGDVTLSDVAGVSADGRVVAGRGWHSGPYAPVLFVMHLPPPQNCTADFDGDGDFGTDFDIQAFFACLGGTCCGACGTSDFNNDGDFGTDADIESFFRVLGGNAC